MIWLSIDPSSTWRISWPRWPGQESSLILQGEVRLLPQPGPEVTPEDTLVATPLEATNEGDTTVDVDYVADMTTTQITWDPWPTSAQDSIPTPAQDAPSTPQDDLALA